MKRTFRKLVRMVVLLLLLAGAGGYWWLNEQLKPLAGGTDRYLRFESRTDLGDALTRLEKEGYVRNARALFLYARVRRQNVPVATGTYRLKPNLDRDAVLALLRKPIRQMVRVPAYYWIARTAKLLEEKEVCTAAEYIAATRRPADFQKLFPFPLPADSLEGYLYPDTYDLPPLLGAEQTIMRQLAAFQKKVWEPLGEPKELHRALVIGSMVQLEAALDEERPKIAGVIENRIAKKMRLQIDATVNYALQEWRPLLRAEYASVKSPYNTYLIPGLPPGPICSPTVASIAGALHPDKHDYLYYVAMPERFHLFSSDYGEHLRNIQKRKAALAKEAAKP
ncbi:MAG: endolytic transglycosylase MltG [Fimbriimonadaceae bacterium]|nr:endolytic transglycosylase MltG [Fimbriimonadaceae bacterium]